MSDLFKTEQAPESSLEAYCSYKVCCRFTITRIRYSAYNFSVIFQEVVATHDEILKTRILSHWDWILTLNAWCPTNGHKYLNKTAAESFQLVLKMWVFAAHWVLLQAFATFVVGLKTNNSVWGSNIFNMLQFRSNKSKWSLF